MSRFQYPEARRSEHVDEFHGKSIPDPYEWLHNPDSEETVAFVKAQNSISEPYLKTELRDKYKERSVRTSWRSNFGLTVLRLGLNTQHVNIVQLSQTWLSFP